MTQPTEGLIQVIDAIKAQLSEAFLGVDVAFFEPGNANAVTAPAILIDIEAMPLSSDFHDKTVVDVHWAFYCVLANTEQNVQLAMRTFVVSVLQIIQKEGIWLPDFAFIEQPQSITAQPDTRIPALSSEVSAWAVRFKQTLHLGDAYWDVQGVVPQHIYLARVKKGDAHAKSEHELIYSL